MDAFREIGYTGQTIAAFLQGEHCLQTRSEILTALEKTEVDAGLHDGATTVAQLKTWVRRFVNERDWDQYHFPKDLAIGLSIEAGEVLEHFRFRSNEEIAALLDDEKFARTVGHELADVLYFVLLMCANMGLDASQLLKEKLAISGERYPVEKARGRNLKYTELSRLTQEEEKE